MRTTRLSSRNRTTYPEPFACDEKAALLRDQIKELKHIVDGGKPEYLLKKFMLKRPSR